MRLIDKMFTDAPFYGKRKMAEYLRQEHKKTVGCRRVRRLMLLMCLEVIYPKPNTSKAAPQHKVYPYLLRGITATRPNHIWSIDITYIRMPKGFLYLVAIIDWFSRFVLAWELSNSMDTSFCLEALKRALAAYGVPDIFNSDQGSQFTCADFTGELEAHGARISMDGRGRALDNIFVERLWRTVKYEEVYLNDYSSGLDAFQRLDAYFHFYNYTRLHQALGYRTPAALYCGRNN